MTPPSTRSTDNSATARSLEQLASGSGELKCTLVLYVAGMAPRSLQAFATIRELCEQNLKGRYQLTVVDIYQQPELAREAQIIAAPTLIKLSPPPVCRMIGDLSDRQRVLTVLNLQVS